MSRSRPRCACLALLLLWPPAASAPSVLEPPDARVAALVDEIAAQFVAQSQNQALEGGPGEKRVLSARKRYSSEISPLWTDQSRPTDSCSFERPADGRAPRIPNLVHWAWRSGDADWVLAMSVAFASVVLRPDRLLVHTGPVHSDLDRTYTTPATDDGRRALQCIEAAGATEVRHASEPSPLGAGRHPWESILRGARRGHGKLTKGQFAHISDVMRLHTLVEWGGVYLDRDAFVHRPLDHYRWTYRAALGVDPRTYENDVDANFGTIMGEPNSTYFRLLWDGMGAPAYAKNARATARVDDEAEPPPPLSLSSFRYENTSYRVTWGGWAHDSCRKSFALAVKRPDLVHLDERLYQYPFPGGGRLAPKTNNGKIDGPFLANTRTHEVLHMSGFGWHSLRDAQLKWEPSIFGEVVWPNILEAAARPPAIAPALRECLDWFEQTLIDKGYMKAPSEYPEKNNLPHC